MRYLLDSDALSDLYDPEAPGHEGMTQQLASLDSSDQVFISILALYELEYGFANAPAEKKAVIRKRISDAQKDFPILSLTAEGAGLFGSLKAGLRQLRQLSDKKVKSHNIDLMLAATAISEECVLGSPGFHLSRCPAVPYRPEVGGLEMTRESSVRSSPQGTLSPRDMTIKAEEDYRATLQEIESLMAAEPGTPEGERLDVLVTLVEAYERTNFPLDPPGSGCTKGSALPVP